MRRISHNSSAIVVRSHVVFVFEMRYKKQKVKPLSRQRVKRCRPEKTKFWRVDLNVNYFRWSTASKIMLSRILEVGEAPFKMAEPS